MLCVYINTLCIHVVLDTLYYYVVFTYVSTCPNVHLCSYMYLHITYVSLSAFNFQVIFLQLPGELGCVTDSFT